MRPFPSALFSTILAAVSAVRASNVDLSTVPRRDSVQLTIYNSADLTLVRDRRTITFKKGVNPLQFSWADTLIDHSSVQLKFLSHAEKLDVLDTTFPHDKPQMLYWNVQSEMDGEADVEITYFTSGITWSADYEVVAGRDEAHASVAGFVKVTNNSGEDYDNAQVRLVVGQMNLVQEIADLAQLPMDKIRELDESARRTYVQGVFRRAADREMGGGLFGGGGAGGGSAGLPTTQPKEVVKEELSEYFLFTIEGTETVPNGWSKRLRALEAKDVPIRIEYRYRPEQYGEELVRLYLMTNDKHSNLGATPLPDGTVRIFRDNGRGGLSFIDAQETKYIPIGDKFELNLGVDPDVIFELVKLRATRDHVWMQIKGTDLYSEVGGPAKIEMDSSVAGWDDHALYAQRVRNYTSKPINVEVRRPFDGHTVFRSGLKPVLHDFRTVQFAATINAGERTDLLFETVTHRGHNTGQENVTLEAADVKP